MMTNRAPCPCRNREPQPKVIIIHAEDGDADYQRWRKSLGPDFYERSETKYATTPCGVKVTITCLKTQPS